MSFKSTGLVFAEKPSIGIELTNLPDRSRFGNHGTYTGVTDVQLPSGLWVRSFNGSTDKVTIADAPSLNPVSGLTLAVWLTHSADTWEMVLAKRVSGGDDAYQLNTENTGGNGTPSFSIWVANAEKKVSSVYDITDAWNFIVGIYNKIDLRIYFDGGLACTPTAETGNIDITTDPVNVGWGFSDDYGWLGKVALPKILNYPLSAGQIKKIYEAERHWFGV